MSDLFGESPPPEKEDSFDLLGQENQDSVLDDFDAGDTVKASSLSAFGDMGLWPEYANPVLLGLDSAQTQLLDMWHSGKFPHALAICGPKGIGKATLAFHLARFILNETDSHNQDGLFGGAGQDALFDGGDAPVQSLAIPLENRAFSQVISGGHPDILTIGDFYKGTDEVDPNFSPAIDDIRRVPSFLQKTSGYGGWRAVIVDNADMMNLNAQNAILKVLEEPPAKALLILVVHREGAMLPTIKSRIRTLRCAPLTDLVIKELLLKDNPNLDPDEADLLVLLANGSAGKAISFARAGGAEHMPKVLGLLAGLSDMKGSEIDAFCDTMGAKNNTELLRQWRDIVLWLIEAVVQSKARGSNPFADMDMSGHLSLKMAMQNFLAHGSVQDWLNVLEELKDHFYECDTRHLDAYHEIFTALSILKNGLNNKKKAA